MRDIVTHNTQLSSVPYKVCSSINAAVRLSSRYYWMICYLFTQTVFHLRSLSANHRLLYAFLYESSNRFYWVGCTRMLIARWWISCHDFAYTGLRLMHIWEVFTYTQRHHTHVDFTRHRSVCKHQRDFADTRSEKRVLCRWIDSWPQTGAARHENERKEISVWFSSCFTSRVAPFAKLYY